MQSFTYDELTPRAQDMALERYHEEQIFQEFLAEYEEATEEDLRDYMASLPWRFTEHGERVA